MPHSHIAIVESMSMVDRPRLSERVDRFLRWFFTASPDEVVPPAPRIPPQPRRRTVAHRKPTRVRPHHCGPVRVAVKAKQ